MNPAWSMTNPHPRFSYRWARFNMRIAAIDWRYWRGRDKRKAKEWLAAALDWRKTAADKLTP